ncbi:MAG: TetR/AcrR family transcriptional regulator [Cytophagaceae bacterium]|nr:TetR/AcrR family transcriptional regulator [Gemmatimonadaceae bacterium]
MTTPTRRAAGRPQNTDSRNAILILQAALGEFSTQGYAATTASGVARRAAISLRTVQRLFPSKDDFFREVVRMTVIQTIEATAAAEGELEATAVDQVRRFAHRYWRSMERPEMVALMRLTVAELPRFPELAVFHTSESLERLLRELERIVAGGVARGELRTLDVRASARTVLATLGAHALWFAYPDIYSGLTGMDRERAAALTIETLLQSLGAPTSG